MSLKKVDRAKGIRYGGRLWQHNGDGYATAYGEKMVLLTWEFGDIHQCKILYKYEGASMEHISAGLSVPFGLGPQKNIYRAMDHLLYWADRIEKRRPVGVGKFVEKLMKDWPSQYPDEEAVWDHVLFSSGGGYDWFNGEILSGDIDSRETEKSVERAFAKQLRKHHEDYLERTAELRKLAREHGDPELLKLVERMEDPKPTPINEMPRTLSYVHETSLVATVPKDARPDWLKWCWRAANYLIEVPEKKHRNPKNNIEWGKKIVADLKKRFPELLELSTAPR